MGAWVVLLVSAVMEAAWATALGESDGLTRPVPTVVFVVFSVLSLVGLGRAMRTIPTGTSYAVWTGIGAAGTFLVGIVFFGDASSLGRYLGVLLIISGVVVLKLSH